MPREGYVVVTITTEAKERLDELKRTMRARSLSDVIIQLYELRQGLIELLERTDGGYRKAHLRKIRY